MRWYSREMCLSNKMVKITLTLLLLSRCFDGRTGCQTEGNEFQKKREELYRDLLGTYDNRIIPKCTHYPVNVSIQLVPREIVDVFERQEIVKFRLWIRLTWFDCNLVWDPDTYCGISTFVVPYDDIWIPDVTLLEGVDNIANMPDMKEYRALVNSNGTVHYNFPTVVPTACSMDLKYYPYDIQKCSITFMPWIHNSDDVDLESESMYGELSHFLDNQEFIVKEVPASLTLENYPCCGGNFSKVSFTIKMRRRPVFFMATIAVPFFIITIISCAGFALPSISGEKISFHTTIMLALVVFLLLVQDQFPSASETFPRIAIYFTISMILSSVSCVMSAVVMYIYYNDLSGKKMHRWVRMVFIEWLGKIMLVKERNLPYHAYQTTDGEKVQLPPGVTWDDLSKSRKSHKSFVILNTVFDNRLSKSTETEETLPKMRNHGYVSNNRNNGNKSEDKNDEEDVKSADSANTRKMNDWELLAYTMDRFFTIFYIFMTFVNSLVFFTVMKAHETDE
ncbi:neuronal acetylcholine receptor subunit alpha-9-like [Saccostrea cucullata]|uniref:neuronal acetylcholine receptor subunit alpha-9-like n=1 Tax=Saccostrea cuccullata TaxID=36930 RepID=UPI002ED64B88